MHYFKSVTAAIIIFLTSATVSIAQVTDSSSGNFNVQVKSRTNLSRQILPYKKSFNLKPYIVPGLMIAYGFTAIENDGFKDINAEFKDEIYAENPHKKIPVDNYLQFAPAAAVYGLNALGIKGKHNFRDRSMIFAMSNIILTGTVYSLKKITAVQRPDGSAYTSFPSGHTAEAFASAEFMRMEYKNVSFWYGIAGYAMAAATGYLRMYNNKHWLSDVVTGAGVGITSTKLAYWLYPRIQHKLFKNKFSSTVVMPAYQNGVFMVGMVHLF